MKLVSSVKPFEKSALKLGTVKLAFNRLYKTSVEQKGV